jgi:hypothetical protein
MRDGHARRLWEKRQDRGRARGSFCSRGQTVTAGGGRGCGGGDSGAEEQSSARGESAPEQEGAPEDGESAQRSAAEREIEAADGWVASGRETRQHVDHRRLDTASSLFCFVVCCVVAGLRSSISDMHGTDDTPEET